MFICFIASSGIVLTLPSDIPIYLSVFSMHPHQHYQCHFSDWYFGRPLLCPSFILYNPLLYCLPTFILSLILTHNCTYILWISLKISKYVRPALWCKKKKLFSLLLFLPYLRKKVNAYRSRILCIHLNPLYVHVRLI